jgi:hydrogenase maturation factor
VDFIGASTWEELCREWLLRASAFGSLLFSPDRVRCAWTRKAQVDVVGINRMEKTLILGECKWNRHRIGRDILLDLITKINEFIPKEGDWRVLHLGFARAGWTDPTRQYPDHVPRSKKAHANWRPIGMELLDLKQVDEDLSNWT